MRSGVVYQAMNVWCVLGDSGGVVNSLDFCLASLKSLGWFYFRCVLSSQWQAVTVNLRLLVRKITKRIHSSKPASLNRPIYSLFVVVGQLRT